LSDFIANTAQNIKLMLEDIGAQDIQELFSDIRPNMRPVSFNLPAGKSEF